MTVPIEINFFRGKAVNVNVYCFSLITVSNVGACFLEVTRYVLHFFSVYYKRKTMQRWLVFATMRHCFTEIIVSF